MWSSQNSFRRKVQYHRNWFSESIHFAVPAIQVRILLFRIRPFHTRIKWKWSKRDSQHFLFAPFDARFSSLKWQINLFSHFSPLANWVGTLRVNELMKSGLTQWNRPPVCRQCVFARACCIQQIIAIFVLSFRINLLFILLSIKHDECHPPNAPAGIMQMGRRFTVWFDFCEILWTFL